MTPAQPGTLEPYEGDAVHLVPGGGWTFTFGDGSTAPVIAWAVCRDGSVRALASLGEGHAGYPEHSDFTVSHPDETFAPAPALAAG